MPYRVRRNLYGANESTSDTCTEDEAKGSTALIRKVLQQYEREGKVEESQRLRKLFEVEQLPEQEVHTSYQQPMTTTSTTSDGTLGPL